MNTANNIIMNRDISGMGGEDAGKSSAEIRLERKQKLAPWAITRRRFCRTTGC